MAAEHNGGHMQTFEERRRDPFFTENAYQEHRKGTESMFTDPHFAESREQIKEAAKDLTSARRCSFHRVMCFIADAWMRYSAGEPLESLRDHVKYAFDDLQRHNEAFPDHTFKLWEPDAYYYTMMLTSWTVLFNLPECLNILVEHISRDPEDGEDSFIHAVFSALGIQDFPGKEAGLLHEDPYGILFASLDGSREEQQNAMRKYLKCWYRSESIKGCYWRERHSFNPAVHLGYWAFETGMLTVLNGLDDSGYRERGFYPRDLVDYCREQGWHKDMAERLTVVRGK